MGYHHLLFVFIILFGNEEKDARGGNSQINIQRSVPPDSSFRYRLHFLNHDFLMNTTLRKLQRSIGSGNAS